MSEHFSKTSNGKVTLISSRVFRKKDGSLRDELIDQSDTKAPGIHLNADSPGGWQNKEDDQKTKLTINSKKTSEEDLLITSSMPL